MTDTDPTRKRPRKAVIYCRVSDAMQVEKGHGLHSQEAVCREYARRRGYDVEMVFHDNITGAAANRPAMNELLAHLAKTKRDGGRVVIIDHINRFARDSRVHWPLRDEVTRLGGFLETPDMEFGDDPESELMETVIVAVSSHQRKSNAKQTKDRMRGRIMNGYYPFYTPRGYRHEHRRGEGKVLVRDEPDASILKEALEGFASGRLQSKAEVKRFLSAHPSFAAVNNQLTQLILTRPIYAGYVGKEEWGIPLRRGKHEALIDFSTFERIQARLHERPKAPARKDISVDFPLRNMVACGECGKPLTACWSKSKTGAKHPYYYCFEKTCPQRGKSIRRAQIEGEFEALLRRITPAPKFLNLASALFKDGWHQRCAQARSLAETCRMEVLQAERQITKLLDRVVDATSDSIIKAYEKRIDELERRKILMAERAENAVVPKDTFENSFELALGFLASPYNVWKSGEIENRRLALRLTFSELLHYDRNGGFRTPKTSYPFKLLGEISAGLKQMAEAVRFELTGPCEGFGRPKVRRGVSSVR